ncbi:SMP-30/gluconolactonase/LRE family protein [Mesorhizobium sp. ASY16-5R]|uniref:SMP-30/gluconolactonase/LRE family protein n=1 Tax=Mesorhizobium sp. ASY16-5R TaxID=3445772 RepID=UPI003F9FF4EF
MHYTPDKNDHGLAYSPFNALVSPRPIGWISTLTPTGPVNLAPYSFYNAVSGHPPFVMFASSTPKDSRRNAEQAGEFVVNLAGFAMRDAMGRSSEAVAEEVSEPDLLGIDMAPSIAVKTPRVALAQAALECRYDKTVISNKQMFVDTEPFNSGADGMTIDAEGFLWVAFVNSGEIARFDPLGRTALVVDMPCRMPTNVGFGGPTLDALYVTSLKQTPNITADGPGAGWLYSITGLGVKGLPETRFNG